MEEHTQANQVRYIEVGEDKLLRASETENVLSDSNSEFDKQLKHKLKQECSDETDSQFSDTNSAEKLGVASDRSKERCMY